MDSKTIFEDTLKAEAGFTVDVWELLTDIEFVLLYKRGKQSRCIELVSIHFVSQRLIINS